MCIDKVYCNLCKSLFICYCLYNWYFILMCIKIWVLWGMFCFFFVYVFEFVFCLWIKEFLLGFSEWCICESFCWSWILVGEFFCGCWCFVCICWFGWCFCFCLEIWSWFCFVFCFFLMKISRSCNLSYCSCFLGFWFLYWICLY